MLIGSRWSGKRVDGYLRNWVKKRADEGFLCDHILELRDDVLTESTEKGRTETALQRIKRIEETDDHTFIDITPVVAHVLPRERATEEDYDAFVEELRARCGVESASGRARKLRPSPLIRRLR